MGLAFVALSLMHASAHASTHRAALVIEHGASWGGPRVLWKCVEFAQATISGLALLELAGVNSGQPPQVYDWGGGAVTVCQINGEPRQVPDRCFGPVSGPNWSDWRATPAGWVPRNSGSAGYSVSDGDVEGWTYTGGFGSRPPSVTFSQVCPPTAPPAPAVKATRQPGPTGQPVGPVRASATTMAAPTPTPTPAIEALAPLAAPTPQARLAATSDSPPARPPASPAPLLLLATMVAFLAGLFAWNLRRRGS
jgi:hypothetical protein